MKESIYNLPFDKLVDVLTSNGFKKFRATQIFDFLYQKRVNNFSDMKNIGKDLTTFLEENYHMETLNTDKVVKSKDGTIKFLFQLLDGYFIETVMMPQKYGLSVCVSSEVGCLVGCRFCASAITSRKRSLKASEMILQIFEVEKYLGQKINSVVVMGIGEPFLNYDNLINFIRILNDHKAFNLGARRITVSTSGIYPKIKEFADLKLQVNLAISFHSPFNEVRSKMMPINRKYPIDKLIEAINYYLDKVKRRIAIEYILIKNVNDREKDAIELAKTFKDMNVYVNLIPYNVVFEREYERSEKQQMLKFLDILKKNNIDATLRKEFGHDIDAACGQLRAKKINSCNKSNNK